MSAPPGWGQSLGVPPGSCFNPGKGASPGAFPRPALLSDLSSLQIPAGSPWDSISAGPLPDMATLPGAVLRAAHAKVMQWLS